MAEEELVLCESGVLEFICRATAVDGSTNPLNGIVIIIIATPITMTIANADRFLG
ncbi:MAG TPA: hypothetical protein VEL11_03335 [Candidatus Bathyarchaeia archaeon]|nr:hypothetical protein [Candidatus Bathyarchaeia archaeon]